MSASAVCPLISVLCPPSSDNILSLPIYPEITDEMIAYVAERIAGFFRNER
jgi:hypothetical protein